MSSRPPNHLHSLFSQTLSATPPKPALQAEGCPMVANMISTNEPLLVIQPPPLGYVFQFQPLSRVNSGLQNNLISSQSQTLPKVTDWSSKSSPRGCRVSGKEATPLKWASWPKFNVTFSEKPQTLQTNRHFGLLPFRSTSKYPSESASI